MQQSKLKQISLIVCLALMPIQALSAGLGKLHVNSGLGEPLSAEIELLSLTPDELASLSVAVAPEEAYAVQGIPRLSIHNNIRVEISKAADGSPILKLNSVQPISDPYLDMLIQVDWSSGRLLREYTILLDPPEYKTAIKDAAPDPVSVIKPISSAPSNFISDTEQIADGRAAPKSNKTKSTTIKPVQSVPTEDSIVTDAPIEAIELTTSRGDSLAAIAREVKPEGVSLDQMLVGLFEANKHAFVDGNMNRLKVGQIIKVPTRDTLLATNNQQAKQQVKLHSSNWNVYRNTVAGNLVASDAAELSQEKQSSSGKVSSAEDLAAIKKAGPQDVVKLSAGGKQASTEYDAKVIALQEETVAKEKALKEAEERAAALEAQIADMQKLLALKNQAMANLQQNAQNAVMATPDAGLAQAEPLSAPEVKSAAPPARPTLSSTYPKQAAVKSLPLAEITNPDHESSLLDSLIENINVLLLAAAGALTLLAAGWVYLRNKRRRDLDNFERGIFTSGGLSANTVFGNVTNNADATDTSFLTDYAQSTGATMIDANDVDPIAEAEVYMAYGRDAQAEEILKDAIIKEPKRYELHLKLLEMYAARKDVSAFDTIAGELYTMLGSSSLIWAKVAELGIAVEPSNPLYDLSQIKTQSADLINDEVNGEVASADLDTEAVSNTVTQLANDDEFSQEMPAQDSGISDGSLSETIADNSSVSDNSLNFDFTKLGQFSADSLVASGNDPYKNVEDASNNIEFAPALTMPEAITDGSVSVQKVSGRAADGADQNVGLDFKVERPNQQPMMETEETAPSVSFEAVDFVEQSEESDTQAENALMMQPENVAIPDLSGISLDLNDLEAVAEKQAEEIQFDLPVVDDAIEITMPAPDDESPATQPFDLASINLELTDNTPVTNGQEATEPALAPVDYNEDPNVDIKLDLVRVYIDMEDREGARDLLNEVLNACGPKQRQTAEQLLASLD